MGAGSSAPQSTRTESGVEVAVKDRYHAYLPKNIDRHVVLTEEKVKLVHDHWNFIADEVCVCVFFVFASRVVQIRLSFIHLFFGIFIFPCIRSGTHRRWATASRRFATPDRRSGRRRARWKEW